MSRKRLRWGIDMKDLYKEVETLRYHQGLLINVIKNREAELDLLFVEKNLTREEGRALLKICETLSNKMEIEKAEGYLHFQPLLQQLRNQINPKLSIYELIRSCLKQGVYSEFMQEMEKELKL